VIEGVGSFTGGTTLRFNNATGDCITFSTSGHQAIRHCYISANIRRTSGFAIKFTGNCFQPMIEDVRIDYHYNGVWVNACADALIRTLRCRYMLGTVGVQIKGTDASNGVYGCSLDGYNCDNPYPTGAYGAVVAWATSTAYTANQITSVNSNIYQCTTSGTSAGAGSGPSGIPGTGTDDAFSTTITDGTAVWKFVCSSSLTWLLQDSYAYSCSLNGEAALINGAYGFRMTDAVASGTSYPMWFNSDNLEIDHPFYLCVDLSGGEGFYGSQGWWGSCLTGSGVVAQTTYRGEVSIDGGTRIHGNAENGLLWQAGPVGLNVANSFFALNSQESSGTYHQINLAASSTDVTITGNTLGLSPQGTGQAGYGVYGGAGVARVTITGNNLTGNVTGGTNLVAYTALSSTATTLTGISAGARMVVLNIVGMSWDNTASVRIRIGPSGGVATSGYLSANATLQHAAAVVVTAGTAGFDASSIAASGIYNGQLIFTLADSATNTWTCQGQLAQSAITIVHQFAGSVPLSGALERIAITTVAATASADAGSVSVLVYT
jgi:hypothetical protein